MADEIISNEIIANDLSSFDSSVETFGSTYTQLEKDFEEVQNLMKSLDGMWSGQAHDALQARFKGDESTVKAMLEYMKDISQDLNYAKRQYKECENQVGGLIEALKI